MKAEARARPLQASDAVAALELLREHPVRNVLLEHVVRAGALGRLPGFFGVEIEGRLEAVLMVGALGGASLEIRRPEACAPLAEWASRLGSPPRHLTGAEEVIVPFWDAYAPRIDHRLIWSRRERVYVLEGHDSAARAALERLEGERPGERLRRAREEDIDQIVENSARQHVEDLKEDRLAMDPPGFWARHSSEVREGHWWVLAEGSSVRFQVHVGPRNDHVIQLGGVFTPVAVRRRGHATRGLRTLAQRLLQERPGISLFCAEDNPIACRLYERLGFTTRFYNRSYLLELHSRYA